MSRYLFMRSIVRVFAVIALQQGCSEPPVIESTSPVSVKSSRSLAPESGVEPRSQAPPVIAETDEVINRLLELISDEAVDEGAVRELQRELEVSHADIGETCDEFAMFAVIRAELREMQTRLRDGVDLQGSGFEDYVFSHREAQASLSGLEIETLQTRLSGLLEMVHVEAIRERLGELAGRAARLAEASARWDRVAQLVGQAVTVEELVGVPEDVLGSARRLVELRAQSRGLPQVPEDLDGSIASIRETLDLFDALFAIADDEEVPVRLLGAGRDIFDSLAQRLDLATERLASTVSEAANGLAEPAEARELAARLVVAGEGDSPIRDEVRTLLVRVGEDIVSLLEATREVGEAPDVGALDQIATRTRRRLRAPHARDFVGNLPERFEAAVAARRAVLNTG